MNLDWIFPLLALTIYLATPKGCDKAINWILAGIFVIIWGFQESIHGSSKIDWLAPYFYDGLWFDVAMFSIYAVGAFFFHRSGGKIQKRLAILGMILCALYAYFGTTGLYSNGDKTVDMFYDEVFIALYIAQLFVAGGGMMFALSNKLLGGFHADLRDNSSHSRNNNANHGDS